MSKIAFIFGNGVSRLSVKDDLRPYGKVYVCNRAAFDLEHDYCIAVDKGISKELQQHNYKVYTREGNVISRNSFVLPVNSGWSSGPAAASLAAYNGSDYIFLLGMDLKSNTDKINNIYAGTEHYSPVDSIPTPYSNWVSQIKELMQQYVNTRFIHVNPLQGFTPESWNQQKNFTVMSYNNFLSMINIL